MTPTQASDPDALLATAAIDRRAGRLADAQRLCRAVLALRPDDAVALHLLGLTEIQLGQFDAGVALIERAIVRDPAQADFHLSLAQALRRGERLEQAAAAARQAVALAPARLDAFEALVHTIAEQTRRAPAGDFPSAAATASDDDTRSVSVVVCSVDDAKCRRIRAHYETLLAGRNFEIVQIRDARSLCEAYNRGFGKCSGDVVIFSHDDIEIVSAAFAARLLRHLSSHDVVGVAGTSRLAGPSWISAGWPHIHGLIAHRAPAGRGLGVECYGPPSRSARIEAVDGVFLAVRRAVCEQIAFDEETFDGFHFYDLDFSYRAATAGFRIVVPWDILIVHDSGGRNDAAWRQQAQKFLAKHQDRMPLPAGTPPVKWASVPFATQVKALEFHRRMIEMEALNCVRAPADAPG